MWQRYLRRGYRSRVFAARVLDGLAAAVRRHGFPGSSSRSTPGRPIGLALPSARGRPSSAATGNGAVCGAGIRSSSISPVSTHAPGHLAANAATSGTSSLEWWSFCPRGTRTGAGPTSSMDVAHAPRPDPPRTGSPDAVRRLSTRVTCRLAYDSLTEQRYCDLSHAIGSLVAGLRGRLSRFLSIGQHLVVPDNPPLAAQTILPVRNARRGSSARDPTCQVPNPLTA